MRSATGVEPAEATHVRQSELCATCHTLYHAGPRTGRLARRLAARSRCHTWNGGTVPSATSGAASRVTCPSVANTPISSVLGEPRESLAKHTFLGGNFFMLRMLNRYRAELGVEAPAQELDAAAHATIRQLQDETAEIALTRATRVERTLEVDVAVRNLTGHKLPTGYPSRRAWLHVTVEDAAGRTVFESGAVNDKGMIAGNDNDADPLRFEPHYEEIRQPDQVQIYESMMADAGGTRDDRTAAGRRVHEGQSAVAARLRQAHRRP